MIIVNSILAFVAAIGLLVTVHEFGHFLAARLAGVKVLRFSIGFGPPLLRWGGRDGGTEYVVAALPLGGYVKMLDEREGEVAASERALSYNAKSIPSRLSIVLAGPAFNFLFAILAYWVVYMAGIPGLKPVVGEVVPESPAAVAGFEERDRIVAVNGESTPTWSAASIALLQGVLDETPIRVEVERVSGARETLALQVVAERRALTEPGALLPGLGIREWMPAFVPEIGEVQAGSPAERAGLRQGDRVVVSAGEPVTAVSAWIEQIRANPGKPLEVLVERNGERLQLMLTPEAIEEDGQAVGRIGAAVGTPRELYEQWFAEERLSPGAALWRGVVQTADVSALTLRVLGRMLTGDVSLKNLSGPINIADYAGRSASYGVVSFLVFLAVVSVSLGVLNLLPVPILDGGHALFLGWEALRGAPPSAAAEAMGQRLGLMLIALLMCLAFYNDIMRLVGG
ncbi:MAG TPA: RIP metalloprotease RseP [Gammaproteobacteria bacterium]|nr:RIP metalloprotease RseP [Gammaproteobacteria bacterium]